MIKSNDLEIKTRLYDKHFRQWNGMVLVWEIERKSWFGSDITHAHYTYRDENGIKRQIQYEIDYVLNNPGQYFEGKYKIDKYGNQYWRGPFRTYSQRELTITERRTIDESF